MFKRSLAVGLSVLMSISALTGCGSKIENQPESNGSTVSTETDKQSSEKANGEDVTITYISSTILESPEGDFEKKCIEEFNALDNGITVEVEGVSANDRCV